MPIPHMFRRPRALITALAVVAIAATLPACSPTRLLNRMVPDSTYAFEGDIAYGSEPRQQLDTYLPLAGTGSPSAGRPMVVFFYGGAWTTGDRATFKFVGEALASRGAVVVIPDYRLSPEVTYPVFVRDSARAMKWAFDNAARLGVDPKRIFVMGHSSGAYNAAMLALDPRWLADVEASPKQLAGWIGLAGPYDFLPIENPDAQAAFNWPRTPRDSQPIAHVSAASPRALLMAVTKDNLVDPVRNTEQMAQKLQTLGVPVETHEFDNLSHVTLIGALAKPLQWLGGPVLPPIVSFIGLSPKTADTIFHDPPSPTAVSTAMNERATQ